MVDFSIAQWAFFVFAVTLAFGVRGGAGFGGGVVAVPLLALLAPLQVVVPLTSALNTTASLSQGFRDWRKVEWREMARILPFALIGVVAGIYFLANIDPQPLSRGFGLFVVLYACYALFSKGGAPAIPPRWLTPVAAVMSLIAGVIGSVFGGAAGPIFVIYLNSLKVEKDRFRATMTMLMLTLGTTRLIGYVIAGMYTQKVLLLLALAIPLTYIGGRLGSRVAQRIDQRLFNRVVGMVLLASGVILLLKQMLDAFSVMQLAWAAGAVFAAYVLRGMSGFGAGLIATPLLAFVLPMSTVVPATALIVFVLFILLTIRDRHQVLWDEFRRLLLPTIIGVACGLYLFTMLDNRLMLKLLGGFLLAYAAYMLISQWVGMAQLRLSGKWAWPLGFSGAFIDSMFGGGGGTLVVIYMHGRDVGKEAFRATLAALWFVEMIERIGGYTLAGYYTESTLALVAAMLPFMLLGTWVGEKINARISHETFSKVLAVMLLLSGASLLLK